ncbi:MAG: DUF2240 family protein [Candidatus Lokiarchaeota archaeon]|nr:DUF2240 family protein [Candidatus Lokiarchaeota archaeon]
MKIDDYIKKIIEETGLHKNEIEDLVKKKKEELKGLISEEGALFIIAKELGVDIKDQDSDYLEDIEINISDITSNMRNIILVGRIKEILRIHTFDKKDGSTGKVGSFLLSDSSGDIRVVIWDDKTEILEDDHFKIDELVKLVNGYAKEGKYGIEVHIGNLGKIILSPNDINHKKYPKIKPIGIVPINDINLTQRLISLQGKVIEKGRINEFEKKDGTAGKVSSIFLKDSTSNIKVTIWDDKIDQLNNIETGNFIKITNLNPKKNKFDPNQIELSSSFSTEITKEQKDLDIKEEIIKKINTLQEMNNIVSFRGIISAIDNLRRINLRSGEEVTLLSIVVSDDTDGIRITFWKENAEKYSKMLQMGQGIVLNNVLLKYSEFSKRKEITFIKNSELEFKDLNIKNLIELDTNRTGDRNSSYTGNYTNIKDIDSSGIFEIKGVIVKELNNITIYEACSKCGRKTNNCTCEEIGESENRMILNLIIDDGTGTIRCVFVAKNAETLINENTKTISEKINNTEYNSFLEEISKRLVGNNLIIKGKAKYSDYSNAYEISVYNFKELNVNEELERLINEIDV